MADCAENLSGLKHTAEDMDSRISLRIIIVLYVCAKRFLSFCLYFFIFSAGVFGSFSPLSVFKKTSRGFIKHIMQSDSMQKTFDLKVPLIRVLWLDDVDVLFDTIILTKQKEGELFLLSKIRTKPETRAKL